MIPIFKPILGEKEKEYILKCLDDNWISFNGPFNKKFERCFATFCESRHAICVTNGTAALHLALLSIGIGKGDEVIVPDFTMASCGFAVVYCGAKPIFVDSEADTWNMDAQKIEAQITKRTKAIMVVHIFGHPCDMDSIMAIAQKHKLKVVEDCAEAHGALFNDRKVGSFGDVAAFSFYANKVITTGEGGMLVTKNSHIAERARWLHSLSFDKARRFIHAEIGYNYRMTNLQAAIGLAQLEKIDAIIEKKRKIADLYSYYLKRIEGITTPTEKEHTKNIYWMYGVIVEDEFGINKEALINKLTAGGIETRHFFTPMHQQPCFSMFDYNTEEFEVSKRLSARGFYLPSATDLKDEQIEFICQKISTARH